MLRSKRRVVSFLATLLTGWLAGASPSPGAGEVPESFAPEVGGIAIIQRLQASGDVEALIRLLRQDPRVLVRAAAAMALAKFREERVYKALVEALHDQDKWVRMGVIGALAFFGGEEVKEPLQEAAKDPDQEVRHLAEQALARLAPGREVRFSTIDHGTTSGVRKRAAFIIKTEEEWKSLWSQHRSSGPPPVDFAQEMAIAVFRGEQPTAGFDLKIQKLEEKGGSLYVFVQEASPAPGSAVLQVLTQPYHIIRVERKDIPIRIVYQASQK